jgi:hypothetical protein
MESEAARFHSAIKINIWKNGIRGHRSLFSHRNKYLKEWNLRPSDLILA